MAKKYPKKLAELRLDFDIAAKKNHIYPLKDTFFSLMPNSVRPYLTNGRTDFTYFGGPFRYSDAAFPDMLDKSWRITADIDVAAKDPDGMIVTQGGWFGGWGLMVRNGKPEFIYMTTSRADDGVDLIGTKLLPPGHHVLKVDFTYDGGGIAKGAAILLTVDGETTAKGHLNRSIGFIVGEEATIGWDSGTALTEDYKLPFKYPDTIHSVKIHLARPE